MSPIVEEQIEQGRTISHLTWVNNSHGSSKIIFPKQVIRHLSLDAGNAYIEWVIQKGRDGRKEAVVRKFHKQI